MAASLVQTHTAFHRRQIRRNFRPRRPNESPPLRQTRVPPSTDANHQNLLITLMNLVNCSPRNLTPPATPPQKKIGNFCQRFTNRKHTTKTSPVSDTPCRSVPGSRHDTLTISTEFGHSVERWSYCERRFSPSVSLLPRASCREQPVSPDAIRCDLGKAVSARRMQNAHPISGAGLIRGRDCRLGRSPVGFSLPCARRGIERRFRSDRHVEDIESSLDMLDNPSFCGVSSI
jgi:hypothetical protein